MVTEYFANNYMHTCEVTFDVAEGLDGGAPIECRAVARDACRPGTDTQTGGRLKRVLRTSAPKSLPKYGDGLANGRTSHAARGPPRRKEGRPGDRRAAGGGRSAPSEVEGGRVAEFREKPAGDGSWINAVFGPIAAHRR